MKKNKLIILLVCSVILCYIIDPSLFTNILNGGGQAHCRIYQYGDIGNDWCFVRTPAGYNPFRNKPYPLIIVNHGNGWVMDGSPEKANYTKRTMYVPYDDKDYASSPTQYNPVDASDDRLYSNPTIEALLAEGYVVAGAQNYADAQYGNEDCANAVYNFYEHIQKNYNVTKSCGFIGASNGCLTSLSALKKLGTNVNAMVFQYPLIDLYDFYSIHDKRKDVLTAHKISSRDITEEEMKKATGFSYTKDSSYIFEGFPPTKVYYSMEDTVTPAASNSIPFINILNNNGVVVDGQEVSGEHGDYSHFEPTAIVEWFNKWQKDE